MDCAALPNERNARSAFSIEIQRLLAEDHEIKKRIEETIALPACVLHLRPTKAGENRLGEMRMVDRLEMIYLLRTGRTLEEVAKLFRIDIGLLVRLATSYSLAGAVGLLPENGIEDRLDRNDPILRRLEIVRLVRSGTPVAVIAQAYGVPEEHVERVNERFSRKGVLGVLTEDDLNRLVALSPSHVRVCTYNLHGIHTDSPFRFRRIAGELAAMEPHICAFQEAISGAGIDETSAQIGRWMSSITEYDYRSKFCYCHQFMEKYPEGVAVSLRSPLKRSRSVDLTALRDGLKPSMPRNALQCKQKSWPQNCPRLGPSGPQRRFGSTSCTGPKAGCRGATRE